METTVLQKQRGTGMSIAGKDASEWAVEFPLVQSLMDLEECAWFNPSVAPTDEALGDIGLTMADVDDAAARLMRFAPYIAQVFPETRRSAGIIESPLVCVPGMQSSVKEVTGAPIPGRLWAKLDSELPISGSIKARGGIYEVLQHAESIALTHGLITEESDYRALDSDDARAVFGRYRLAVGSTGNLGLSIGVMAAKLGFKASVHMSADARQWKKDKLRLHGVEVVEYESDYSVAVKAGREQAADDPSVYFVDDENSTSLFLGYAVAARRLAGQLQATEVHVSEDAPLIVYLPCGVGGGPGGIAFGLKTMFGDAVRCIFAEPTHSPAMFLGTYTGLHDAVSVGDFGIDNVTAADGLAVGRPSGFVGKAMQRLLDGFYTVSDDAMFHLVAAFYDAEGYGIEPSSATGFAGPQHVLAHAEYRARAGLSEEVLARATHLAWVTGGSMVPDAEMRGYVERGRG